MADVPQKDEGRKVVKWAEIRVHTAGEAEEAVAHILHETGATGVVIEDASLLKRHIDPSLGEVYELTEKAYPSEEVVLKAYLPMNRALPGIIEGVRRRVAALSTYQLDIGPGRVSVHEVDSNDWETAWKKHYKPIQISERLVVKPTWETYEVSDHKDIIIELDPGMAFGTGMHPSTILSLRAIEKVIRGDEHVIDVGCGSGILSIAAAKLGAAAVTAIDLDEVAVTAARENIVTNQVESKITVRQGDLLKGISGEYDVIVANILAEVIVRVAPDVAMRLTPGGYYIPSGIIKAKEGLVRETLIEHHFIIKKTLHQDDWVAIIAQKR